MHIAMKALLAAGALALAGCAAPPAAEEAADPAAAALESSGTNHNQLTGSRIPNPKTTDRVVRSVGQQSFRSSMDTQARPLNAPGE